MKTSIKMVLTAVTLCTATAAVAGSPVEGVGDSRAAAMQDANRNAANMSQNRFGRSDCRTPAKVADCRQDSGGWICIAYLANHAGSCGF